LTEDPQEIDNQNNSDSESENESTSEESYTDTTEQIGAPSTNSIIQTRDSLFARTDSIVIFLTQDGEPCDDGAHLLTKDNRVPIIKNGIFGKARVIKQGCRYLIALIVETKVSALLEETILKEAFHFLYDVIPELQLQTISISKTDAGNVSRITIEKFLRELFYDSLLKIIECDNYVTIPKIPDRIQIITENHASAIESHKGITKTYKKIRHNYFWPGMKSEIRKYIQECRNCQLKKLTRTKTRQPMILTDTPGAAFDKISMDIVGPLPITKDGHSYILTIQDLLTKYLVAVPLKQATSVEITETLVEKFINTIYIAPKAWIRLRIKDRIL